MKPRFEVRKHPEPSIWLYAMWDDGRIEEFQIKRGHTDGLLVIDGTTYFYAMFPLVDDFEIYELVRRPVVTGNNGPLGEAPAVEFDVLILRLLNLLRKGSKIVRNTNVLSKAEVT